MRPTHRITLLLATTALLASCSTQRTTLRSARTTSIESRIIQMPTVADLEVADRPVRMDTAWVNRIFKGSVSPRQQTKLLIAQMLEREDADLLVEPKISHESEKGRHNLSVSGYPARYKSFRNATLADIETINALRKPTLQAPIVLADMAGTPYAGLTRDTRQTLAIDKVARKMKSKRNWRVKYHGMLDVGYVIDAGDYGYGNVYGISTTHGVQFGLYFFTGIGAGFYYVSESSNLVPVYIDLRGYFSKKRFSPYVDFRVGGEFTENKSYVIGGGAGVKYGHLDLGVEYMYFDAAADFGSGSQLNALRIRVGFNF